MRTPHSSTPVTGIQRTRTPKLVTRLGALIGILLISAGAGAASDCLDPLRANARWRCHAELSNGESVDYCLQHTNRFGVDAASRSFKTVSSGAYTASCTCEAKGSLPGAAFGTHKSFLCLDRATDTVIRGKASKRRMSGETFSVIADVRSTYSCEPDPACDVPAVLDPDLPPETGFFHPIPGGKAPVVPVTGGGSVAIGGLGQGCTGYTSEAPEFVFRFEPGPAGIAEFNIGGGGSNPGDPLLLVRTPSGAVHCSDFRLELPLERGRYAAWVTSPFAATPVPITLRGFYREQ